MKRKNDDAPAEAKPKRPTTVEGRERLRQQNALNEKARKYYASRKHTKMTKSQPKRFIGDDNTNSE